jgi:hypothetical protein
MAQKGEAMIVDPVEDRFPALLSRRRPIDAAVDRARRVLWRAYQRGTLNEEEFASTLERLEFGSQVENPSSDQGRRANSSLSDG